MYAAGTESVAETDSEPVFKRIFAVTVKTSSVATVPPVEPEGEVMPTLLTTTAGVGGGVFGGIAA